MSASELFAPPPPSDLFRLSLRSVLYFSSPRRLPSLRASAAASDDAPARAIGRGAPVPPWLLHPPSPPENPFAFADPWIGSPSPFLMLQTRSRLPSSSAAAPLDTPAARAVSALLFTIGEVQRPAFAGQEAPDRVSRDRRDSFLWLFRRVFSNSPNLVPLVLLLLSRFIALSAERAAAKEGEGDTAVAVEEEEEEEEVKEKEAKEEEDGKERGKVKWNYKGWADIGIREGELGDEAKVVERRRRAYERAIAEGEVSSLLLCNYAQLLYRIAQDHDRAEHYFKWAAMAEPRDAEAIGHYALFMWEARGDVACAEELFLEALEVDPHSFYHSSNYAWFLWKTGAEDTCFPLSSLPPTSQEMRDV